MESGGVGVEGEREGERVLVDVDFGGGQEGKIEEEEVWGGLGWFGASRAQPSGIGSKILSVHVRGTPVEVANGTRERLWRRRQDRRRVTYQHRQAESQQMSRFIVGREGYMLLMWLLSRE